MHFGKPSAEECNAYTRVLLGNLDLERVKFPAGSSIHGGDLDVLARRWLWADGLDYGHGTGHGVGYYLNVHEGPCGISKYRSEPLVPGMVVSNGNIIILSYKTQSQDTIKMGPLELE
jgi:Xaa-Pro aminopeptidase